MSHGAPGDGYGGGILNHGTLTVSDCTVSNNDAREGGGIFSDGTLTVSGCSISGNHAIGGGGISNTGTASLFNSTVSNNQATWVDGAYQPHGVGGGLYVSGGTLTLSGCTVSGNYADLEASGIYNDTSGTMTLENSSTNRQDVYNLGVGYVDSTSTIGFVQGNPFISFTSLTISPSSLSAATTNANYSVTFTASGGSDSYSFSLLSGILPSGMSLTSGGLLSGTTPTAGFFSFTIQASDNSQPGITGSQASHSAVNPASTLTLSPATIPPIATAKDSYGPITFSPTGGYWTYTFKVATGRSAGRL